RETLASDPRAADPLDPRPPGHRNLRPPTAPAPYHLPPMPTPATVHPSAILRGEVELAEGVEIGPGCTLTGGGAGGEAGAGPIRLGPGVRLIAGAHLLGPVTIGAGTVAHPG